MKQTRPLLEALKEAIDSAKAYGSDEDIKARQPVLRRKYVREVCTFWALIFGWFATIAGLWCTATYHPDLFVVVRVMRDVTFFVLVSPLMSLLCAWSPGEILEGFVPLSESRLCDDSLKLVTDSPAARALRDAVVEAGRQLYVFDYRAMTKLASAEYQTDAAAAARAEAKRQLCAELHGIA